MQMDFIILLKKLSIVSGDISFPKSSKDEIKMDLFKLQLKSFLLVAKMEREECIQNLKIL